MASTSSTLLSRSAENPSQSAFFSLKRLLNVVGCSTITGFTLTQIGRGRCCVWGIGSRIDFSHIFEMFDDANMRSGLYPFFHIALLNDFGSFSLCMSDSSTASPSLSIEVYPQSVLWLLRSPITILGMFLLVSGGGRNCSAGGLYTECTTTPCSSTVINIILFTDRNVVNLQTISNRNRASMYGVWTFSY